MDLSKLAKEQAKTFADLDKKLTAKPTADMVAKLGTATLAAQITRIDARIARLEEHKKTTVARLDQAIEREREALKAIRSERPDLPFDKLLTEKDYQEVIAQKVGIVDTK